MTAKENKDTRNDGLLQTLFRRVQPLEHTKKVDIAIK